MCDFYFQIYLWTLLVQVYGMCRKNHMHKTRSLEFIMEWQNTSKQNEIELDTKVLIVYVLQWTDEMYSFLLWLLCYSYSESCANCYWFNSTHFCLSYAWESVPTQQSCAGLFDDHFITILQVVFRKHIGCISRNYW
jgi:hypothetical protein